MRSLNSNIIVASLWLATSFLAVGQQQFPHDFFGYYRGELTIERIDGQPIMIPMQIHLLPADTSGRYNFKINYDEGENQSARDYHLLSVDPEQGVFIIDENNGILLDAKVYNNCLHSVFQVEGSMIQVRECFYKKHMDYELIVIDGAQERITFSDPEAIEVRSYPIVSRQHGRLKRYKK